MKEITEYFNELIKKIEDDWTKVSESVSQELSSLEKKLLFNPIEPFRKLKKLWSGKNRRTKAMRAQLTYEYLERVKGVRLDKDELLPLLLMDCIINSTDDLIDNYENKFEVYKNAIAILFSFVYLIDLLPVIPKKVVSNLARIGKNYIIKMSQIPIIEREYFKKIKESNEEKESIRLLVESLEFRGSDIEYFGKVCQAFGKCEEEDAKVLRILRTLQLFYKDMYDLEWDIKNQTKTPLVSLYLKFPERFNEVMKKIYSELQGLIEKYSIYEKEAREFIKKKDGEFKEIYKLEQL